MDRGVDMKKIVVIKSSPRRGSNSSIMADVVIQALKKDDIQVSEFDVNNMNINYCKGCDGCMKLGKCVIKDDAHKILDSIKDCDGIVFATPIYFFNVTAQLKTLIDRLYALYVSKRENTFTGMKIGLILTYGDKDMNVSGAHNAVSIFKETCAIIGGEVIKPLHFSTNEPYKVKGNLGMNKKAVQFAKDMIG